MMLALNRTTKIVDESVTELLRGVRLFFTRFTLLARLYWAGPAS